MQSYKLKIIGSSIWLFDVLIILSLLIFNSCSNFTEISTDDSFIDKSFINSEPCSPPCWYGLEIDKSTKADVLAILDRLTFVDHEKYREYGSVWLNDDNAKEIQFNCTYLKNCGGALISNDKLKILWLRVGYDLSLKEAVDRLKAPDFLVYEFRIQGGCRISLWWVEQGIILETIDNNSIDECQSLSLGKGLTPHKMVRLITYYSKENTGTQGDCCKRIDWPGFTK